ncbi:MAG: sulfotransferase [Gammaproteobacteria bacterium]
MLAVAQGESGELNEALASIERAIGLDPAYVEAHLASGHLLQKLARNEEALDAALKAVEIDDEYAEAWLFLSAIAGQLGRPVDAELWANKAVSLLPDNSEACMNLANAQYELGKHGEAENSYRRVLELRPVSDQAQLGLVRVMMGQYRFAEAAVLTEQILQRKPGDMDALYCLGACYQELGRSDEAIDIFGRITVDRPGYKPAYLAMARLHAQHGALDKAAEYLNQAKLQFPDSVDILEALAEVYREHAIFGMADECYGEILQLDPGNVDARFNHAMLVADTGRYEEAFAELQKLGNDAPEDTRFPVAEAGLREKLGDYEAAQDLILPLIKPEKISAATATIYARLCHRFGDCDNAVNVLERMLPDAALGAKERRSLLFSLGDVHDRLGDYDSAFASYREANSLKVYHYDHGRFVQFINRLIQAGNDGLLESDTAFSSHDASLVPVFIVGMPRSGTSLVEQILASHPQVYGSGERPEILNIVSNLPSLVGDGITPYPECLAMLPAESFGQMAGQYLNSLGASVQDEKFVTDKLPENYHHLVLIRALFPDSRIIHCVRDPLDTCLSCYFQEFTGYHDYAYDLEDLGRHYREYQRLMRHYRDELKIPMLEVKYEELVNETDRVTRGMLDFCGLDWDERCLRYYETERVVRTASYNQVREPVYTRSVGRWKHYAKYLDDLKVSLQQ